MSLRQNEIIESELSKQVLEIVIVASIAVMLVAIGTIQPLLVLVPLVIAWFFVIVFLSGFCLFMISFSSNKSLDLIPFIPEPVEIIGMIAASVYAFFVSPLLGLIA